jgi:hypothetical protein
VQIQACLDVDGAGYEVVPWEAGRGDWARKINYGLTLTDEPFILCAADDLVFHPGWDKPLLQYLDHVGVVGTNDMANPLVKRGSHSTHPAVARWYVREYGTCDEPDKAVHEGYWHNWCDNELVETAKARGMWQFCADSRVEHQHWVWGTAPKDATYERGSEHHRADAQLFRRRRALWRNLRAAGARV